MHTRKNWGKLMSTKSFGTVQGDFIRLDEPTGLPDDSRVEITVKPLDSHHSSWDTFMDKLEQLGSEQPIGSGGVRYTRDQLYERR